MTSVHSDPASKNILIADDEINVRESLKIILNYQGYQVSEAVTGKECMEMLSSSVFDLLILDLKMPDQDGFDVLKSVRERYPQLKVILMTGYGNLEVARKALSLGAINYFDKPIDIDKFIDRVQDALQ